jgi:hypothetical protein
VLDRVKTLAAAHRPFCLLVALGAVIRVLTMVAYPPALFFNDSWGYVFNAFTGHPVSFSYLRPNGYPVLIHLLTLPGRNLVQLIALQHLAGLVTGTLVYAALVRARVSRLLALLAASLVLLDGYMITLEQYVMPEAFFTLTLLVAALLVVWPRLGALDRPEATPAAQAAQAAPATPAAQAAQAAPATPAAQAAPATPAAPAAPAARAAGLAGLLLGAAVIQREAALFTAPFFLLYLLWARVGTRRFAAFTAALVLPVLGYAALYDARFGVFGLTETSGWTLYGRVAAFADCSGAGITKAERPLCESSAQRRSHPGSPTWYIWDGSSPAAKLFHGGHQTRQTQEHANKILDSFAHRILFHHPLKYASVVGGDVLRYFTPGAAPFNDAISATSLPRNAAAEPKNEPDRRRVLPSVHPAVRAPAGLVRAYRALVHAPRPVLALLALASLAALILRLRARRELLLLAGAGLALVIGAAATAGFGLRYMLPAVPLLGIGGSLALGDLATTRRRHSATAGPGQR